MKTYPDNQFADAKEERRQGERAFTMVEIAIAIGVIGFALVAVIGILPAGMNVQKDNREDTTISEDAPFFLDAIRNGGTNSYNSNIVPPNQGLDFLTNYVEKIMLFGVTNGVASQTPYATVTGFGSGWEIVGLLSTPEGLYVSSNNYSVTRAIVRSLSGAAVQQNGANLATSFRYQMDVEIVPFVNIAPDTTNYVFYENLGTNNPEYITRYNRWQEVSTSWLQANKNPPTNGSIYLQPAVGALAYSLFDVRLHFSWPVLPGPNGTEVVGPGRQTYRTTVASAILASPPIVDVPPLWFFQPQLYANHPTIRSE
jgi:type II secretory pathway pseudopilin PulG